MLVVGVDGCPGGWIAVAWETKSGRLTPHFHPTFEDIPTSYPDAACIGVDIPIGLRDDGRPRGCDVAARSLLGWPRGASVFPAPQRRLLLCETYATALALSKETFGKGISRQAFGIYCKVREVDEALTPEMQRRVIEVHPEVSFWAIAGGRPMMHTKKTLAGFEERRELLACYVSPDVPVTKVDAKQRAFYAGPDDFLDVIAAAWTARRHPEGGVVRLRAEPGTDQRGLRMEIVV